MRKTTAIAAVAAVGLGAVHNEAGAAERVDEHCVVHVTGIQRSGQYLTGEPVCYPTLVEALSEAGVPLDASRAGAGFGDIERSGAIALADRTIGIHWDGSNRTGSSITISGGECSGGFVDLSSAWVNRISSTWNACPATRFFDGFGKTGDSEQTGLLTVNLGGLNNRANSISYL